MIYFFFIYRQFDWIWVFFVFLFFNIKKTDKLDLVRSKLNYNWPSIKCLFFRQCCIYIFCYYLLYLGSIHNEWLFSTDYIRTILYSWSSNISSSRTPGSWFTVTKCSKFQEFDDYNDRCTCLCRGCSDHFWLHSPRLVHEVNKRMIKKYFTTK